MKTKQDRMVRSDKMSVIDFWRNRIYILIHSKL
jgi:hypothetical protein